MKDWREDFPGRAASEEEIVELCKTLLNRYEEWRDSGFNYRGVNSSLFSGHRKKLLRLLGNPSLPKYLLDEGRVTRQSLDDYGLELAEYIIKSSE